MEQAFLRQATTSVGTTSSGRLDTPEKRRLATLDDVACRKISKKVSVQDVHVPF